MCGIVGIWNLSGAPADEDIIRKMCGMLVHRGPDGSGVYINRNIALGVESKVHLKVGRAECLEYPDAYFDAVIAMGLVEYSSPLLLKRILVHDDDGLPSLKAKLTGVRVLTLRLAESVRFSWRRRFASST